MLAESREAELGMKGSTRKGLNRKVAKIFAILPAAIAASGSPYGQGTRSMSALKKVYNQGFLNCVFAMHEIHQGPRDNHGV